MTLHLFILSLLVAVTVVAESSSNSSNSSIDKRDFSAARHHSSSNSYNHNHPKNKKDDDDDEIVPDPLDVIAKRNLRRTLNWRRDVARHGMCPSNGNAHVVYLTTNNGNNIESYDTFGRFLGYVINSSSLPHGVMLQKLRGMIYGPDGLLYVAASRGSISRIFALSPSGLPPLTVEEDKLEKERRAAAAVNSDLLTPPPLPASSNKRNNGENKDNNNNNPDYEDQLLERSFGARNAAAYNDVLSNFYTRDRTVARDAAIQSAAAALYRLPPQYRMNTDCSRNYVYTFAKFDNIINPNMNHPYSFFFHPDDGTLFVANQNSLTITRYVGPSTTKAQVLSIFSETAKRLKKTAKLKASLESLLHTVTPVETNDPMPFAGGRSGYNGMPLPPSSTLLRALRLEESNDTATSSASSSSNNINDNNIVNKNEEVAVTTIPKKAVGVFAAGWSPFYNLLSIRGIAISPPMWYSVADKMFLHEMNPIQHKAALEQSGINNNNNNVNINNGSDINSNNNINSNSPIIRLRVILAADVVSNAIHVFHEHSGELLWSYTSAIRQPIQIHFPLTARKTRTNEDYWFYVTSKDGGVYKLRLRRGQSLHNNPAVVLVQPGRPMKAVSGFYENLAHNTIYIADRVGRAVYTYGTVDTDDQEKYLTYTGVFAKNMVDFPEHVLYTAVESQRNIPYCHELTRRGTLRYTSLCRAAQLWFIIIIFMLGGYVLLFTTIGLAIQKWCRSRTSKKYKQESDEDMQ